MVLFYYNMTRNNLPVAIDIAEFKDKRQAKEILKKVYAKNEGEDSITVAAYDTYIDKENEITLTDMLIKYVDFPFVEFYVIAPKKDYHLGNTRVNVVLPFDAKLKDRTEHFREIGSKVHAIDDIKMFFVGHEMRLPDSFS